MNNESINTNKNQTAKSSNKTFNDSVKSSFKVKKFILLCLAFIISYLVSFLLNGFEKTNRNLLTLLICSVIGFVLFYAIYGIAYFITSLKIKNKQKKVASNVVNCDEEASKILNAENKPFNFDKSQNLKENLNSYFKNSLIPVIDAVADKYGKKSKTSYLNFSVYDGLDFFGNLVDAVYYKVDGVLNSLPLSPFKLADKPIGFLKNFLVKALYDNKEELQDKKDKKPSKIKEFFTNAALTVFRKKINGLFDGVTEFCALEGVKIFSKNGKINNTKKAVNENG